MWYHHHYDLSSMSVSFLEIISLSIWNSSKTDLNRLYVLGLNSLTFSWTNLNIWTTLTIVSIAKSHRQENTFVNRVQVLSSLRITIADIITLSNNKLTLFFFECIQLMTNLSSSTDNYQWNIFKSYLQAEIDYCITCYM